MMPTSVKKDVSSSVLSCLFGSVRACIRGSGVDFASVQLSAFAWSVFRLLCRLVNHADAAVHFVVCEHTQALPPPPPFFIFHPAH